MPEETNTEEVVVEETPVEETPTEEVTSEVTPEPLIAIPLTMYGTREQLEFIADYRGYPTKILNENAPDGAPLEEMYIDNPVSKIDWLTAHTKDILANLAAEPFVMKAKREEAERAKEAEREALRLAKLSIQ